MFPAALCWVNPWQPMYVPQGQLQLQLKDHGVVKKIIKSLEVMDSTIILWQLILLPQSQLLSVKYIVYIGTVWYRKSVVY